MMIMMNSDDGSSHIDNYEDDSDYDKSLRTRTITTFMKMIVLQ